MLRNQRPKITQDAFKCSSRVADNYTYVHEETDRASDVLEQFPAPNRFRPQGTCTTICHAENHTAPLPVLTFPPRLIDVHGSEYGALLP